MRKQWRFGFGVLIITGGSVDAQTLNIDHQPVGCVVAERFPRLEARLSPADKVAVARVVFQGESTQEWYSVVMKAEGSAFFGVLPRPKKSLKAFRYYIEVTDQALGTNRTTDYTTSVVDSSGACKARIMAGTVASASVLIQGPGGVVALPAGFAPTGVVTAGSAAGSGSAVGGAAGGAGSGGASAGATAAGGGGGGLSAATIGIVGGTVAGAALVATQALGGGATYSGLFQTVTVMTRRSGTAGQVLCSVTLAIVGTLRIEDFGGGDGQLSGEWSERETGGSCGYPGQSDRLDGDLDSGAPGNIQFSRSFSGSVDTGSVTRTRSFSGALTGGAIVGVWTMSFDFRSTTSPGGGFITKAYPPTGAPVTLQKQ